MGKIKLERLQIGIVRIFLKYERAVSVDSTSNVALVCMARNFDHVSVCLFDKFVR